MPNSQGRLIPLAPGGPAENMAIDQALLESVESSGQPVLRFYGWAEPTLSLGYFQKLDDRQSHRESEDLVCVRRATGGGAIIHHHELTYSVLTRGAGASAGPRLELYRQTHQAFVTALARFGISATPFRNFAKKNTSEQKKDGRHERSEQNPFLCFQRRTDEDLVLSGYKILGSAQRKSRLATLQHGSLLLKSTTRAPQLPGVFELTSKSISPEELATEVAAELGCTLSISWANSVLSDSETARTEQIVKDRFAAERWLERR